MFTGIVKELGTVKGLERSGGVYRIGIYCGTVVNDVQTRDSISINGACLTLVEKKNSTLYFDIVEETAGRTALTGLKAGDIVNIEDSLKAGAYLSGHFVLGHIDCIGRVKAVSKSTAGYIMEICFPENFSDLIVDKGSVTVDGVSLTIAEAKDDSFSVHLIPHTLKITNLGGKNTGDNVNIEFDIIGKYMARLKRMNEGHAITEDFLKEKGF